MTPGQIVSTFIAHIESGALDEAFALLSDDVEYDNVPIGKNIGVDAVRGVLGPFSAMCTAIEWVVHVQVEQGEYVMNERTDRFEINGSWVELPVAGLFRVVAGRISLWRDYFDDATFRKMLGG